MRLLLTAWLMLVAGPAAHARSGDPVEAVVPVVATAASEAASAAAVATPTAASAPAPRASVSTRERPREFLDSLSETAVTSDRRAIYRQDGKRREVDLGRGLLAVFDERPGTAMSPTSGVPDSAGEPARMIGLDWQPPGGAAGLWYERGGSYRLWRSSGAVRLGEDWTIIAGTRRLTSSTEDWNTLAATSLARRDHALGLRWASPASVWSSELLLRRSSLEPEPATEVAPAVTGNQLLWRNEWRVAEQPGLSLSAQLAGPVGGRSGPDDLDRPSLTLGASQRFGPDSWWPGARLYWLEAMPASMLAQDDALTRNAVWSRMIGLDLPYGPARTAAATAHRAAGTEPASGMGDTVAISAGAPSADAVSGLGTGGAFYTQWRDRSLLDPADRQWLIGWRQGWPMAPDWSLQTQVEQVIPAGGSSPKRSLRLSEGLAYRKFPYRSYGLDLTLVDADSSDSAYLSLKQTERLADDWLGVLRFNIGRRQPHNMPSAGISDAKLAVTVGWREPEQRTLHVLARYTLVRNEVDSQFHDPAATDRLAHLLMAQVGDRSGIWSGSLRVGRRLDYDEVYGRSVPRRTDVAIGRVIVLDAARVSLSAHVAERSDALDGRSFGWGSEVGLRLSRLAVLAVGYNPRGFSDNELTLDERPRQGWTLRLRFSIEGAIGRWLDAGRSAPLGRRPASPVLPDLAQVSGNVVEP